MLDRGDGGPLDPREFTKAFKGFAKAAGLPERTRLHDVRHGYATALIGTKTPVAVTAALLGHASAAFTINRYGHPDDKMKEEAAAALDQAYGQPPATGMGR